MSSLPVSTTGALFGCFFPSFTLPQKVIELMLECLCPPSILRMGIVRSAAVPFLAILESAGCAKEGGAFFFPFPLLSQKRGIFRSCGAGKYCIAVHVTVLLLIQYCGLHGSCSFNLVWSLPVGSRWFENIPVKKEKNRLFSKLHHKTISIVHRQPTRLQSFTGVLSCGSGYLVVCKKQGFC